MRPDIDGKQVNQKSAEIELSAYPLCATPLQIVPAWVKRSWMNKAAMRCLPLLMANQSGWFILNGVDFEACWNGCADPSSVTISASTKNHLPLSQFGLGIITWLIPYLFKTAPGYNLAVRGPTNWCKDGIVPLDGVVETDWAVAPFTMSWKITRENHPIRFSKGDPICMIAPQRRGELSQFRPCIRVKDDHQVYRAAEEWFSSRYAFVESLSENPQADDWQGHYFKGVSPSGHIAPEHEIKLHLGEFQLEKE